MFWTDFHFFFHFKNKNFSDTIWANSVLIRLPYSYSRENTIWYDSFVINKSNKISSGDTTSAKTYGRDKHTLRSSNVIKGTTVPKPMMTTSAADTWSESQFDVSSSIREKKYNENFPHKSHRLFMTVTQVIHLSNWVKKTTKTCRTEWYTLQLCNRHDETTFHRYNYLPTAKSIKSLDRRFVRSSMSVSISVNLSSSLSKDTKTRSLLCLA